MNTYKNTKTGETEFIMTKGEAEARLQTLYALIINETKENGVEAGCRLQNRLWPDMEKMMNIIKPEKKED